MTDKIDLLKKIDDYLSAELVTHIEDKINDLNKILTILTIVTIVVVVLIIGFVMAILKNITTSLSLFQSGLLNFFKYLNKETTNAEDIRVNTNDEIGLMAQVVNDNIHKTTISLEEELKFINDVQVVMDRVQNGWFSQHIKANTKNPLLLKLKETINHALENLKENFITINGILENYSNHNYIQELNLNHIEKD
jgi:methyl-accepting chemotaxis protein